MLNYTVPPLQFLIGGFDASEYLDSISLSVPMHEIGQDLLWSGQFKISRNLRARANGLTDGDFSEYGTPTRWRPYQQVVRLNIKGYLSPAFRIENYRYDPNTASGQGTLTQIPTAVAGDRPGVEVAATGGTIGGAIDRLLDAAFAGATVQASHAIYADGGVLDVPLTTRNAWSDALRLSNLSWHWLSVNTAESIVSVNGSASVLVFGRVLAQVELVPDLAAIYQSATKVIVTGARQVEDKTPIAEKKQTPSVPRPKFKTTTEYRPAGVIFSSLETDTTPVLFEEKTIIYQYWDDDSWSKYLPIFSNPLTAFLFDIQSQTQSGINIYGTPPPDLSVPLQTITLKRQPVGYLFPAVGVNTNLTEAEVLVESNLRKLTIKPIGVVLPSAGVDTTLIIEKRESLTSAVIPPGAQATPQSIDANGNIQKYETRPLLEAPQPIATRPLKTEVLKGSAQLNPLNWTPVFSKPLVVDFGFLPDASRADFLAQRIAIREQRRRDQVLVDMPIPNEWLANGWPLLGKCQIGGDTYLMDGCAISISDGQAKFGFAGGLVGKGTSVIIDGVPTIVAQAQYQIFEELDAQLVFEASVASAPAAGVTGDLIFDMVVGSGIRIDLAADLTLDCVVASSPGLLVPSDVAFDSIVSAVDYQVVPVPSEVVFDSIVTVGLLQRIDFTVSPSSVLEGSPVVQTIDFTVSPSFVLEG